MNTVQRALLRYGVTAVIGLIIAIPLAFSRGFAPGQAFALNARYLSDGFFVSGVLLTGIGAMSWIATTGFFDIFSYGMRSLLVLFTALVKPKSHKTFYEFKLERDEKRKAGSYFILIVGLAFIALAFIFVTIYNAG